LGQTLAADLRALDGLRKGLKTPLDAVDSRGAELLKKYEEPADQAQIHYMLAHVHAQSGVQRPAQIVEHGRTALESKLVTPEQRMTLYSYLCSAHQVDKTVKDPADRRRNAVTPLLEGLAELEAMKLPAKAPPLPELRPIRAGFPDEGKVETGPQRVDEASRLAREQAERTGKMVGLRDMLKNQVMWLYYVAPVADDELQKLAAEKVSDALTKELLEMTKTERERIEQARKEQQKKLSD
jgi:hypothetical protein